MQNLNAITSSKTNTATLVGSYICITLLTIRSTKCKEKIFFKEFWNVQPLSGIRAYERMNALLSNCADLVNFSMRTGLCEAKCHRKTFSQRLKHQYCFSRLVELRTYRYDPI